MSWIRLEAAYFSNPAMIRAGWDGKIVFLALMTMVKLHNVTGAELCKDDCEPAVLRAHLGVPESRHSDEQFEHGIQQCIRVGLIEDTGSTYKIRAWSKYQIDPTAKDRAKKYRESKREKTASRDAPSRHANHGDGTGRTGQDVRTGQDGENHPPSPALGGGDPFASLSPEEARDLVLSWAARRTERKGPHHDRAAGTLRANRESRLRLDLEIAWIARNDPDMGRRVLRSIRRAQQTAAATAGANA